MDRYLFDIKPVHDKNPFFNYFLRLVNIKAIYKTMSHNWLYFINEGYMLPVIFLVIMMLSIFIILLPVFISSIFIKYFSDSPQTQHSFSLPTLAYFAMLGLGFMLIEVSIIQKSILIFENPSYAIAIVLFIILLSSGLGSMSASKFSLLRSPYSLVALSFIACAYIFILNEIFISVSILSLYLKVLVMFLVTLPLGFFMGLPFPIGMRLLGQKNETMIPWAWAINACFSVLSPILAILLALTFGFNTVLGVAVLIYLVAFISLKKLNT